ncbi:Transcriptional regulator PadR-like family protein [Dyadobacter soli]|uniref:Transcriptional regulator PadR-like family protein n=1 Tax=Dyadobacter soli TaxID=659014 RepID=A0A1G7FTP3_9BACT|nr:helix-turn-helix transcriptional regulator [Dyadobacter soli]SDE79189.1 Transcriptional regulator PadR-like family protein [Dyadobacter soli]
MKGTNLGEFEELVLLTIASLAAEAYSVAICDELERYTGRSAKLGVVHAVLNRLEEKGLAKSRLGDASATRGGKRKRFYEVSHAGKVALMRAKELRESIWRNIPGFNLEGSI